MKIDDLGSARAASVVISMIFLQYVSNQREPCSRTKRLLKRVAPLAFSPLNVDIHFESEPCKRSVGSNRWRSEDASVSVRPIGRYIQGRWWT